MQQFWQRRVGRRRALLGVAALAAGAALPASAGARELAPVAPAPTAGVAAADDLDAVKTAIQQTMDRFAEARSKGDESILAQALDGRNAAFRRIVGDQLKNWQSLAAQNRLQPVSYRVDGVRPALGGLMKGDLTAIYAPFRESGGGTLTGTYIFRNVDGNWLLTEPLEAELGERRLTQTDHFRIRYFEWDADQIDHLEGLFESAYASDTAKLGFGAPEQIYATVSPTFAVNPSLTNRAYAYYASGTLHVRSPESYGYGLSVPGSADDSFLTTLQHEYGHHLTRTRTQGRTIKPWMDEGMSDWLASTFRRGTLLVGFNDNVIPDNLLDWADARIFNENTQVPNEVGMGYALGANAVRYIDTQRGGLDQFWALVDQYVTTRDWDASIQSTFGQSWTDFQAAYRTWVKAWATG